MNKRKMLWECAKLLNFSIAFQGISDLLLLAIPTFTAYLTGKMLDSLLYMDIAAIKSGLIPFLIAIFIGIFLEPIMSMLSCVIVFVQSLKHDQSSIKHFLNKDYLDTRKLTESEFQERLTNDLIMYRYTIIFTLSQPFIILLYGIEVIYMLQQSSGNIVFLIIVLLSAAIPVVRAAINGKLDANMKKKENEYLEKRRNNETIMYDSHNFIKASKIDNYFIDKSNQEFESYIKTDGKIKAHLESCINTLDFFSDNAMNFIVLIAGCLFIAKSYIPAGSVFSAILILPSIKKWYGFIKRLITYSKRKSMLEDRVYYLYENEEANSQTIDEFESISTQAVSFGYTDNNTILKNVNFSINKGEKYVITGPNGTGKSTLLKLLVGIFKPQHGKFTLNNNDNIVNTTLQEITAYSTQQSYIFNGTLLENITFKSVNDDIESQRARQILDSLGMTQYPIDKLVEDGGENFSIGEKQKISLARAIFKQSELLVLDEPTNHINHACIDFLVNYIQKTNRTLVIVSHDQEFIKRLDKVCKNVDICSLIENTNC